MIEFPHERHAAAHLLVGALVERRQHALVRPALQLFSVLGLGQIPQRGHVGHVRGLAGRHLSVSIAHMARQSVDQGQTMHEQGRARTGKRFIPGAKHLAAAPALLEQGIALRHAAAIGARKVGVACTQLHAKVVERGAADAGATLDHIQVVRAKQNARQHTAHAGGRAPLAVTAKRALAVLYAQPHVQHAPIALEPQLDLARAHAVAHELGSGRMPKRGAARQQLQRLYEVGLPHRVGSREHRHAAAQGQTITVEAAVVRDGKLVGEHSHR